MELVACCHQDAEWAVYELQQQLMVACSPVPTGPILLVDAPRPLSLSSDGLYRIVRADVVHRLNQS